MGLGNLSLLLSGWTRLPPLTTSPAALMPTAATGYKTEGIVKQGGALGAAIVTLPSKLLSQVPLGLEITPRRSTRSCRSQQFSNQVPTRDPHQALVPGELSCTHAALGEIPSSRDKISHFTGLLRSCCQAQEEEFALATSAPHSSSHGAPPCPCRVDLRLHQEAHRHACARSNSSQHCGKHPRIFQGS